MPVESVPGGGNVPITPITAPAVQPEVVGGPGAVAGGGTIAPDTGITPGLAASAPGVTGQVAPGALIKKLSQDGSGFKTVDLIDKPTAKTGVGASYKLGGSTGRQLKPKEQIFLELPEHLRNRAVRTLILCHRQEPSEDSGNTGSWDENPGLTAVHIHDHTLPANKSWRHWSSPWGQSGEQGAKFAEARGSGDPEFETEFDWHVRGHVGVEGHDHSTIGLKGDAVRVRSVGKDAVFVHQIDVKVLPEKPSAYLEIVFSEGTVIGDAETNAGRKLGGGQAYKGKFPGALELGYGNGGAGAAKLQGGWSMKNGALEIALPAGKIVTTIDLACGDSMPDEVKNKDGGWGTPGYARMTMGLLRADGSADWFMNHQGVPPEGVMSESPSDPKYITQAGDRLVIKSSGSTLYVMAARVGTKNPDAVG